MRILFWSELAWPHVGGVEILTRKLMVALCRRGHQVMLIASHADLPLPDERIEDGILVHRLPMQETLTLRRLDLYAQTKRRLVRLKQDFQPDAVHVNFPSPSVLLHWSSSAPNSAPSLLSIHHTLADLTAGPDTLVGRSLRAAAWIVSNSRCTYDDTIRGYPQARDRCSMIYNGLDHPPEPVTALPWDPPRVLCLGRLTRDKGFDVALAAFAEVRRAIPNCRLTVAGNGPEFDTLNALAGSLAIRDAVDFPGWVAPADAKRLLNSATVVIVPSLVRESFGLVALEAMQMGRPVIAADTGALPELVTHQETGLVTPVGDARALASAIVRVLSNRELAAGMGAAGRRRALEDFGLDRYVQEYESLYARLHAASITGQAHAHS
jgi:glycogen synthase